MRVTKERRGHEGRKRPTTVYIGAPARPRVDHARDGPAAARPRPRRLRHRPGDHRARRHDRAVVRPGRQPRRLRLHVRGRAAAVAQEPARQRRRRRDHAGRRRRPQPQLPDPLGLRQRGLVAAARRARPTAAPAPAPSPRRRRSTRLFARITPEFLVNYHSAAELLLYGIGWQVATPSPDDVIYEAMVGDDADPAVPGYDPDISAELYTTNGDTDTHMQEAYGTLGFTPEMSTCETASARRPRRRVGAGGLRERLQLPRRRGADPGRSSRRTSRSRSPSPSRRSDPDDPVSVVGSTGRGLPSSTRFDVSYGDPQTVAVYGEAGAHRRRAALPDQRRRGHDRVRRGVGRRRALRLRERRLLRRVPRRRSQAPQPGDQRRGVVHRHARHDSARLGWRRERALHLHASQQDTGNHVLVIANEDYTGVNPDVPADARPRRSTSTSTSPRCEANGVTRRRLGRRRAGRAARPRRAQPLRRRRLVPRRQPADPGPRGRADRHRSATQVPDLAVAERQQYLTIAVRDFLNEGGKLRPRRRDRRRTTACSAARSAASTTASTARPRRTASSPVDLFSDCLLLADDFTQYYLGAYGRTPLDGRPASSGLDAGPLDGRRGPLRRSGDGRQPDRRGRRVRRRPATCCRPTSSRSSPAQRRPSTSTPTGPFIADRGRPARSAASHADDSYMRLARTFDLTGVDAQPTRRRSRRSSPSTPRPATTTSSSRPTPSARTTGRRCPTSAAARPPTPCRPSARPASSRRAPAPGALPAPAATRALPTARPAAWNSFTGTSDGWVPVAFDLSAYAGQQVEVVVSYVTDPFTGGTGVIVDDTRLVTTTPAPSRPRASRPGSARGRCSARPRAAPATRSTSSGSSGLGGITGVRDDRRHRAARLRPRAAGHGGRAGRRRGRRARPPGRTQLSEGISCREATAR